MNYYWLCIGMFIFSMDIIHAAELPSKPRRLYMQVSPQDQEKLISKKRSRIVHTPCLPSIPEERSVKQKPIVSKDATLTKITTATLKQKAPKFVPSPEIPALAEPQQKLREEHKKEAGRLSPLETIKKLSALKPKSRAEYLSQQKEIRESSLIQLKADYKAIIKKNARVQKKELKLIRLRYSMADAILWHLQSKGYGVGSQQDLDQSKEKYGHNHSHLFFDFIIKVIESCSLGEKERKYIYSSFIRPVEELDDSIEPRDTTADDLRTLIEKIEKPCPCLTTGEPCKKCDAVNLREFDLSE